MNIDSRTDEGAFKYAEEIDDLAKYDFVVELPLNRERVPGGPAIVDPSDDVRTFSAAFVDSSVRDVLVRGPVDMAENGECLPGGSFAIGPRGVVDTLRSVDESSKTVSSAAAAAAVVVFVGSARANDTETADGGDHGGSLFISDLGF